MNDLAVMYHYVRERHSWQGSVPIEPAAFEKQIIQLKEEYTIVLPSELNKDTPKPKCIITFDDATRDQYTTAFPILKKHGVKAYFAVMSGPLVEGRVPTFHLVHTVLSHFDDETIWQELQYSFPSLDNKKADEYYSYEQNIYRKSNKYALNIALKEEDARNFLLAKLATIYPSIEEFIETFYISVEELKDMANAGMELGVHCVNHLPYNQQPLLFFKEEIEPCQIFMREQLGIDPLYYTPAFGGGIHYQQMIEELAPILKQAGFKNGFTTIPEYFDANIGEFWINRKDCNLI